MKSILVAAITALAARAESDTVIRPLLTTGLKYDSNAFITAVDKDDDFVLTLAPQVSMIRETKRINMDLQYRATGSYYFKHPELKTLSHNASLGASAALSPSVRMNLQDSVFYTKDSLQANQAGVQVKRSDIFTNTAALSGEYSMNPNTKLTLDISDNIQEYKDPDLVDNRTDTVGAGVARRVGPSTTVNANYSLKLLTFDGDGNDFTVHNLTFGASSRLYPTLLATVSAGAFYVAGADSRSDWNAAAALAKTFRSSTFNLAYSRAVTNGTGLAAAVNVNSTYSADWTWKATEFTDIKIYGHYSENRSKPSTVDVDTFGTGVNWSYKASARLTLGAGYEHFKQSAAGTGNDYDRDQATVTLTYVPTEWRF